jgi:tetratricopeptide (TPR) repeat protein
VVIEWRWTSTDFERIVFTSRYAAEGFKKWDVSIMNALEFQENFDKAALYKKNGELINALALYRGLYVELVMEAADYAKCLERPKTYEANPKALTPQFLHNAGEYLRSDNLMSLILNNICVILAEAGNKDLARKYFKKSIKYIPGGTDYPDYEMWLKDKTSLS